jgi:hypothetical protein
MFEMTVESKVPAFLAKFGAIQDSMLDELSKEADEINKLYNKTSNTWKAQPRFMKKFDVDARGMSATIWAEDRIYWFVHEGVSVMRAVLTPDFVARTKPRVLDSFSGSGGRLYASKRISKPSYKPRKFTETIIVQREPKFRKRMEQAMVRGARSLIGL